MTDDLINRARLALEGYHKDHRAFGAEIARDSLGLSACDLLPEAIEEIKRLEAKANQMVADKINLRSELLSVQAKLAVAVEAADRIEELETLIKDFFILLDKKEENDGGRVFRPNQIYSCRVQDKEMLDNLLRLMKAAVEFKNA